jgi:uncharacterized protein with PQ loop repeat
VPVTIRVDAPLERRRLTVFFRIILAIPHLIWLTIWGVGAFFVVIVQWFVVLFSGRTTEGLHNFFTSYIRYWVHVNAYIHIASERYPGFLGEKGYEVDVDFDPPREQQRWTVALRLFLLVPVIILAVVISGSGVQPSWRSDGSESSYGASLVGILATAGVLSWFYSLFKARAPEGVTRLMWYTLHFGAVAWSYAFLLTDRFPNPDPAVLGVPRKPSPHPVALTVPQDELERSRLTVFFRLPLAIVHFVWIALWGTVVLVVVILNWIVMLVSGRPLDAFHRFVSAFLRYVTHVDAFVQLVANPFPGFTGTPGSYPVDLELPGPEPQKRVVTLFRIFVAIPALVLTSAVGGALYATAFLGWFASLFTGRMPRGLRNLGAYGLRYSAQTYAYLLLVTDRYPYAGPPADAASVPEDLPVLEPEPSDESPPDAPEPIDPDDPRTVWRDSPFLSKPEPGA